jgi:hypothetical protein
MRSKLQVLMEAMKMTKDVVSLNFIYKGEQYTINHAQGAKMFVIYRVDDNMTVFDTITYK